MKNRSQATRNRSQTGFSWPRETGPIVFHSACRRLISSAVCIQFVETASASARSHNAIFFAQVLLAPSGLRGKVRFAARPDLVVGRLEAPPERLALRARHVGGLAPLLLELADPARDLFGILGRLQRLHLLAELLLDADVGPALPAFDLAKLLQLRRERGLNRLQPAHAIVVVLLGRKRRHGAERGADVGERALGRLHRQIVPARERLDSERAADAGG